MIRLFPSRKIFDAYRHAENGGQALHVYDAMHGQFPDAPTCFKKTKRWGHLIDNDIERLKKTAKELGVNKIVVGRKGKRGQHIDLCGKPLERALSEATG